MAPNELRSIISTGSAYLEQREQLGNNLSHFFLLSLQLLHAPGEVGLDR